MPRNLVGTNTQQKDEPSDEELLAMNMPSEPITFRWRYANKNIQLYERHLRSLRDYGIGSPLQAWMRSRLEWVSDNKLVEKPNGVIVIDVDPQGDVDIELQDQVGAPHFCEDDLIWEDGKLAGCKLHGSLWSCEDGTLVHVPSGLKGACETFARDLMKTLNFQLEEGTLSKEALSEAEVFIVDDEFGIVACAGHEGKLCDKLKACFDKLWSK